MNEFLLVFRTDYQTMNAMTRRSPEEMEANAKRWMEWIDKIETQNKLVSRGNRLGTSGKIVKHGNVIADGPYTEIKECIVGYSILRATSLDEAAELADGCPILKTGGTVEIRQISSM